MDMRKRLIAIVGISALMTSMMSGVVAAQEGTGGTGASVELNCSAPMTVEVTNGDIGFGEVDLTSVQADNDVASADRLDVEVDMGCYLGQWHVDASISAFTAPVPLGIFGADHFELRDANVDSWALDPIEYEGCSPVVPGGIIDFDGFLNGDGGEVLGTASGSLFQLLCIPLGFNLDAAAPFVTTASYQPWLVDLNPFQPSGTYSAELTLELYAD